VAFPTASPTLLAGEIVPKTGLRFVARSGSFLALGNQTLINRAESFDFAEYIMGYQALLKLA